MEKVALCGKILYKRHRVRKMFLGSISNWKAINNVISTNFIKVSNHIKDWGVNMFDNICHSSHLKNSDLCSHTEINSFARSIKLCQVQLLKSTYHICLFCHSVLSFQTQCPHNVSTLSVLNWFLQQEPNMGNDHCEK